MSEITISSISSALSGLEARLRQIKTYLSVSELLDLSEDVAPGMFRKCNFDILLDSSHLCTVGTGGVLLEAFLWTSASYSVRRQWRALMVADKRNLNQDHSVQFSAIVKQAKK